ncbi:MinD-like ATPase involved in chromosome partitioning or flagellar assembly [Galbitalea soli]|nr:regulator [Galbitalea soli]NYJ31535.1 MinD-like ATPase involved in chromosome partitioning or flagellar assembly [Galbitalea soli]
MALAVPASVENALAVGAIRHGHEVVARSASAHELAERVVLARPDLALVVASERYLSEQLVAECDGAGVRLTVVTTSDAEYRYATSLGLVDTVEFDAASLASLGEDPMAVDLVAADACWRRIEEATALRVRPTEPPPVAPAAPEAPRRGAVIAVWGPAGSPGRTTLSIAIAAEIAAAGFSVALADADTHGASIAPTLGMLDESPGFAAACRLAGTDNLTLSELERIGQRYRSGHSGFWVLTGIGRPARWPELSATRVAAAIARCREWVDFTVIDTGASLETDEEISTDLQAPRRNAATLTALAEADRVVAVGAADPVGLSRLLRAHVDLLELVDPTRVIVAMNRLRASAIGPGPAAQVEQTLARFGGISAAAMIPHDQAGVDAAVLTGRTIADAAPRSSARAAIRALVQSQLLPPAPATRRRAARPRADRLALDGVNALRSRARAGSLDRG